MEYAGQTIETRCPPRLVPIVRGKRTPACSRNPRRMTDQTPMRRIPPVYRRLFLVTWFLTTVPFATNVVREHYPAFSLVDHFSFQVDRYQGFHPDIFVHRDGHSYVGNNVIVSVLAAIPLFLFDPVLDYVEGISRHRLETSGPPPTHYRIDKPNRVRFFELVKAQGLELRFGAATFVTTAFLLAPLTALTVVLILHLLLIRGVPRSRAIWLALLFGFGTPVFFRSVSLNHNIFLMYAILPAFALLWTRDGRDGPVSTARRFWSGFLCGFTLAADYAGVVLVTVVLGYLLATRWRAAGWKRAIREAVPFVAGTIPPVLFLLYSQWAMYGNPFLPGQYWMPAVNYTDRGWRGFSWPTPDLYWLNLFSPSYGLFTFGPLLLLAMVPFRWLGGSPILPRRERRFVMVLTLAFLTFQSANQYSRMQFNTGFRYLIPLVPFLFLMAADVLQRLPRRWLMALSVPVLLHSWVLTTFRESVGRSWQMFLAEGIQLPWLRVLRLTSPPDARVITNPLLPTGIVAMSLLIAWGLWRIGRGPTPDTHVPPGANPSTSMATHHG